MPGDIDAYPVSHQMHRSSTVFDPIAISKLWMVTYWNIKQDSVLMDASNNMVWIFWHICTNNYMDNCLPCALAVCLTKPALLSSGFYSSFSSGSYWYSSLPMHAGRMAIYWWIWQQRLLSWTHKESLWNKTSCLWLVSTPMRWTPLKRL